MRRALPFLELLGWAVLIAAPLVAAALLLHSARPIAGGGEAMVRAAALRPALLDVAASADEARATGDIQALESSIAALGRARDAFVESRPVEGAAIEPLVGDLDLAIAELASAARRYALGQGEAGAGGAAFARGSDLADQALGRLGALLDARAANAATARAVAAALAAASALGGIAAVGLQRALRSRERRRADQHEATLYQFSHVLPDVLYVADDHGRLLMVSAGASELLGRDPADMVGRPLADFLAGDGHVAMQSLEGLADRDWLRIDGTRVRLRMEVRPRERDGGGTRIWFGFARDARPDLAMEQALRESEERFRRVLDTAQNGMLVIAADGSLVLHNEALRRLVGYSESELAGLSIGQLLPADDLDRAMALFASRMWSDAAPSQYEMQFVRRDGERLEVELSISAYREAGRAVGVLVEIRDVTDRRRASETIRRLADYDALTALPNRTLFDRHLQRALMDARAAGRIVGVLLVDLDRFKLINDTLGHASGDRLLQAIAARFSSTMPRRYTLARFGGDEFLVLVPGLERPEAVHHAATQVAEALAEPFEHEGQSLRIAASIGASVYPEHGQDAETLVKLAGAAMYQVKDLGGNTFRVYDPTKSGSAPERLALESELERARQQGEFLLHYQPLFDLKSGSTIAVEALIRWRHPERGMIPAADFIAALEETGLILPVGEWVLEEACRQAQAWRQAGHELRISVNLSARQLLAPDLDLVVRRVLQRTGLPPGLLELEVTETTAMLNIEDARGILETLRGIGVRVAIDDFGVGHSSLGRLREFPVSTLKIDRSFVRELEESQDDHAIVKGVIALGHALGLSVVAEGIESESQLAVLRTMGCDIGQGYHYSPPAAAEDVEQHFGSRRKRRRRRAA